MPQFVEGTVQRLANQIMTIDCKDFHPKRSRRQARKRRVSPTASISRTAPTFTRARAQWTGHAYPRRLVTDDRGPSGALCLAVKASSLLGRIQWGFMIGLVPEHEGGADHLLVGLAPSCRDEP